MIAAFDSGPNTGHLAGAVLGGLFLLCPALCRLFGGKKYAMQSVRTGLKIAVLLQVTAVLCAFPPMRALPAHTLVRPSRCS